MPPSFVMGKNIFFNYFSSTWGDIPTYVGIFIACAKKKSNLMTSQVTVIGLKQ